MGRSDDDRDLNYSEKTHLIHGRFQSRRWDYQHHVVPPMSSSVTYRLDSTQRGAQGFLDFAEGHLPSRRPIYIYDRLDEPTRGMLEENLAYAEGGECCVSFASGMAAISAVLGVLLRCGEAVVAHHVLYGCTYSLLHNWLPRQGIRTDFVDFEDREALRTALGRPEVRVVYFETPVNPTLEILDIAAIRREVDEINSQRDSDARVRMVVDNTFATPYCQRPLSCGADLVVHSLTKNIGGFGTDMGGAAIGPRELEGQLLMYRKDFGGVLGTKSAWQILVYGLPTLPVRIRQQQETARAVARFLEQHPAVARVSYPGLESFPQRTLAEQQMRDYEDQFAPGTMLYFTLTGRDPEAVRRFVDAIASEAYCVTLAVSLGQVKTLLEHPWSMTHVGLTADHPDDSGVDPMGVRLSLGLEKGSDIIRDLELALQAAAMDMLTGADNSG
ncbi:MAG: trans-sulfuration enzyme family protein [Candidatus Xenobia bacterium]